MIRPPPLQLKLDNRFPHPVRTPSQTKSQSFFAQLYKANWKNLVIAVAGLNGLRFAYACHNAFADAIVDDAEAAENLTMVSIALAVMYLTALLIEIYGIIGISVQRMGLVRAYLYLTFFSTVLVSAAAVLKGISYFAFAEELVGECIILAMEGRTAEKALFRSHPWPSAAYGMRHITARKLCIYAWVQQSWAHVAAVFLFGVIPAVVYCVLVLAYYRQTIDPKHAASLVHAAHGGGGRSEGTNANARPPRGYAQVGTDSARSTGLSATVAGPSRARRTHGHPARPMRERSVRGVGASTHNYSHNPQHTTYSTASTATLARGGALIPGTKRSAESVVSAATYRSLQRAHRPPPLLGSPSPVGLGHTPGPPSYRPSKVYAAFAAPVAVDAQAAEWGTFV